MVSETPPRFETQAIETIKVGQRVLAKNPEVSSFERHTRGPEPNFASWLHLTLEMPKPDGSNLTINMLRSEEWLRNQIGYVVGEKSTPGERLGGSPPSPNQESGQPKAESRASESPTPGLKAAQSVSPQTENLQPKTSNRKPPTENLQPKTSNRKRPPILIYGTSALVIRPSFRSPRFGRSSLRSC